MIKAQICSGCDNRCITQAKIEVCPVDNRYTDQEEIHIPTESRRLLV